LILHLYDENKLGVSWGIWWWSGWTCWVSMLNRWLLRVPLWFVPHGQASCTLHASKVQCVTPRWCHILFHTSRGLGNRVPPWRVRWHLDDDDILLPRMMSMAFFIVPSCTNPQTTLPRVSCWKKNAQRKYMEGQKM
jgi:hypothetical protein